MGMACSTVSPQTSQTPVSLPSVEQVAFSTSSHVVTVWPGAGMGSPPSVSLQREHCITAVVPSAVQVAGTSGVTSTLKSWFSAGMASPPSVSSQREHVSRRWRPPSCRWRALPASLPR